MNLEIGKTYEIDHTRKGRFTIRIEKDDGEFVLGTIITGVAQVIVRDNERYEGEKIGLRKSFITVLKEI
jgi:hypothetical protein